MADEETMPVGDDAAEDTGLSSMDAVIAQASMQLGSLMLACEDGLQVPAKSVLYELTSDGMRISATGADDASYDNEFASADIDAILEEDEPVVEEPAAEVAPADAPPADKAAA